jgi:hypothetical protein
MAFNRPFSGNGRFNRGGNGGGNNFRGGNQNQDASEQLPNRGIAWGNKYREQQKIGAPVLQGYVTDSNGQKFRLVGFLNPSPDHRESAEAQEYKEQVAAEINQILVEAQESFGIAFNLSLQDEEEWKNERSNASRGGNNRRDGSGGSPRTNFRPTARSQEEDVPFNNNQQDDNGDDPEPDAAPATTRRRAPAKPPATKGKAAKPAPKRASRSTK